jgi:hypothetical protein
MLPLSPAVAWIAATAIGLAAGGFALHFPGSFGGLAAWDPVAVIFGGILGFVTGVGVGIFLWAGLRPPRGTGARLVLAMGLGVGVTHGLLDGAPSSIGSPVAAAASGLAMAAIFAMLLDQRSPAAILSSTIGWGGGQLVASWLTYSVLGMPWHDTPVEWSLQHMVAGIVIALAWGIPTAVAGLPGALQNGRARPTASPSRATA